MNMEELKESAWKKYSEPMKNPHYYRLCFDDGFDSGVKAERERVINLFGMMVNRDAIEKDLAQLLIGQLFPEQEQRSET